MKWSYLNADEMFGKWKKLLEQGKVEIPKPVFPKLTQAEFAKQMLKQQCRAELAFRQLSFRRKLAYTLEWNGWTW